MKINLKEKELFIFDIEGVVLSSIDDEDIAVNSKVVETLEKLREKGKKIAFLSNISRTPFFRVAEILVDFGLAKSQNEVFTAGKVAVEYIKQRKKNARVFVISERGLIVDFEMENSARLVFEKPVDFVVIGMKRNINFEELNFALECILEGAELISVGYTNYYRGRFGSREGVFIGDLPICEMLSFASGKRYIKIGKPDPLIFGFVLAEFGVNPKFAVMVGDKLETDIKGAKNLGITAVLVRSSQTKKHFVPPTRFLSYESPDISITNLEEILDYL
ncbi:Acid sugar phosphatase [bacterium HR19]|nr:Acid sugar phosphatase [bacterium HR19]